MIQYLIILMDDTCSSYCHYCNECKERKLISIEDLKAGIFYAMKENLMIQFVLPDYELPVEYKEVMNSIDSHIIVSSECVDQNAIDAADVIIYNSWLALSSRLLDEDNNYVLRTSKNDYFEHYHELNAVFEKASRISVMFTDITTFEAVDFAKYEQTLFELSKTIVREYAKGHYVQFNLLTDRLLLTKMNNCEAGSTNITLAPNGKFYVCPAFYYGGICDGTEVSLGDICQKGYDIGTLQEGLDIKNPQLYKLDHAPICSHCDAFQCKRCIWLNRQTTLEVNTPSHEQCVMAHVERNVAHQLLSGIRKLGQFMPEQEIKEIDYLDPFDVRNNWKEI